MNINKQVQDFLLSMKMEEAAEEKWKALAGISKDTMEEEFKSETKKLAFWINAYNACFLYLRKIEKLDKSTIYTKNAIRIADYNLSLDDIEHVIIRKNRIKLSLGYLPKLFTAPQLKKWMVEKRDFRIHFALNCGAVSCPPIAFYSADRLEEQLEMATLNFLENETEVLLGERKLRVSRLFLWYHGDFGGRRGIRKIHSEYLKQAFNDFNIEYKDYDWSEDLNRFKDL